MPNYQLTVESGEQGLEIDSFNVTERVSDLFTVWLSIRSRRHDIDLETIVGRRAQLSISSEIGPTESTRVWAGVCSHFEQERTEGGNGVSSYHMRIVPVPWLLTQRQNYRVFQHVSVLDIVDALLNEWQVARVWNVNRAIHPQLEYKVQYGESDYHFMSRLLQEAGINFTFANDVAGQSTIAFWDAMHLAPPIGRPLAYADNPNPGGDREFVTDVRLAHVVKPGAYAIRDYSFRRPLLPLLGQAPPALGPEARYEQVRYQPGSFLKEPCAGDNTPVADDKGIARYDQAHGTLRASRALAGERADKRSVSFKTNAFFLLPGATFTIENHPHHELSRASRLLVTELALHGARGREWSVTGKAVMADSPYLPRITLDKPQVCGIQSATVVGPADEEIHTDEFGRVRVEFPWQRGANMDDNSSCWIRVSQGWAGTGYGMLTIPRVGQEVLVAFLGGDPDQPVIVGRVYNNTQPVPYGLPEHKTRSTWRSNSSPGGNGFNELMFEDLAGSELVYIQAEKNLRKLVKNDETITVERDREKLVKNNETETTQVNRSEVTGGHRTELTRGDRTTVIGGGHRKQVGGEEIERTEGNMRLYVGGDQDLVVKQVKRERVEGACHLIVNGKRNQKINGKQSLTVDGDQHEKVGNNHALDVDNEIHLKAGTALVLEASEDLTIKGPGGFIRIHSGGVIIKGDLVKINSGGAPGSGGGSSPEAPEDANEAEIEEPEAPETDDVSENGLAQ